MRNIVIKLNVITMNNLVITCSNLIMAITNILIMYCCYVINYI